MKNNKPYNAAILALIFSAVALLAAVLFIQPSVSRADLVIKDRDYQAVSARIAPNNDALYILENRSGIMGVFTYEPGKGLVFRGKATLGER